MKAIYLLFALLFSSLASAEELQAPSDNELRASYCIGYLQEALSGTLRIREDLIASNNETVQKNRGPILQILDGDERRYKAALTRLRVYAGRRADKLEATSLIFALKRGRSDYGPSVVESMECQAHCSPRLSEEMCKAKCGESDLQQRVGACTQLGWLPF